MSSARILTAIASATLVFVLLAGLVRGEGDVVKDPTTEPAKAAGENEQASPLDFELKDIDGNQKKLSDFKGSVVLMVNVASRCGHTPQYKGLQSLYEKYKDQGLVVIGVPANNFGAQEPGTEQEIKEFCTTEYNVTFPMMSKISVAGDDKHPLYQWLTDEKRNGDFGGEIGWNFTKFLIDRNGNVIARFNTPTKPEDPKVVETIEKALKAKPAAE